MVESFRTWTAFAGFLCMTYLLAGCSDPSSAKAPSVFPLDPARHRDVEACHEMVLCIAEHLMSEADNDRLLLPQLTMEKEDLSGTLERAGDRFRDELHIDSQTLVNACKRIELSKIESSDFQIGFKDKLGLPERGECVLDVSSPIFLNSEKTSAFLVFRYSKGFGNYGEGGVKLRKMAGVWTVEQQMLTGIQ